jgi:hypothetical protein
MAVVIATMMSVDRLVIFAVFLIFYRFDDSNYQIDWQGLVSICTVDQYFCSLLTFCNPGECSTDIAHLCLSDNWQGVAETICLPEALPVL